ncbi:conserved hypothetical protein [Nitrosococcus halophilus Nc 4]|uniref:Uncharacterized protein n=1 Tax=Nitrosococcus halophilus (strain Nc4) TaxID=472759 RepID=D5BV99_NITHN|nr:hypothetical protein [Nitrosococcus halophilus]ADE15449.1 conserved hypothetical protein [Nitrosococcus halophilus Nc 4]
MLRYFLSLCLLRSGPADAPPSSALLTQTLLAYLGIGWLISMLHLEFVDGLLSSTVDTVLLIGMTGGLLAVRGYTARLQQTLIALTGAGIILGILALPLLLWLDAAQQAGLPPGVVSLLLFGLMIWSLAVTAHIMRQALSVSFTVGVLIAVIYALVSIQVMNFLFPPA